MSGHLSAAIAGLFAASEPTNDVREASLMALARIKRARQMEEIARPMRELFDELASGEVCVIDGEASMRLPDVDPIAGLDGAGEWGPIAPALRGWIDCWRRLAPRLSLQHMQYLADRLDQDKAVTPRLVERARAEFEETIRRLHDMPDGAITRAITTTQIGWEMERVMGSAT